MSSPILPPLYPPSEPYQGELYQHPTTGKIYRFVGDKWIDIDIDFKAGCRELTTLEKINYINNTLEKEDD